MASLESATVILQLINSLNRKVTVTDLVELLAMPKSSASRLLRQMKELGLLERDELIRAYGPALMILELSHLVRATTALSDLMQQALKGLCARSGHTGYISVLEGRDVVVLFVQSGTHPLRVMTYPGHRSPAWATSTGRVLLALEGDDALQKRFSEPLPFVSSEAPAHFQELIARLNEVRAKGYAFAANEAVSGVGSVSCAVTDPTTRERLAFCLSFPAAEADAKSIQALATDLLAEATSLGRSVCDPAWGSPVRLNNG